jgi:hypothetical protein
LNTFFLVARPFSVAHLFSARSRLTISSGSVFMSFLACVQLLVAMDAHWDTVSHFLTAEHIPH